MVRAALLTLSLALLPLAPAGAQSRPQSLPPPPPGVPPQPVGRTPATPTEPTPAAPEAATPARTAAPAPDASRGAAQPPQSQMSPAAQALAAATSRVGGEPAPTEDLLGLPVYPAARFLRSYDAGQGQRYYLYGATASYAELVAYYRSTLRTRGDEVYDAPPVHMFEVGRFREQTMAFPPGVTIKDYTWGGSKGYLVPIPGAVPDRYPTIIQIVPVPLNDR